jgi:hypothetical protein
MGGVDHMNPFKPQQRTIYQAKHEFTSHVSPDGAYFTHKREVGHDQGKLDESLLMLGHKGTPRDNIPGMVVYATGLERHPTTIKSGITESA